MSEQPPAVREQITREVQPGFAGAVVELARAVMAALPPAFIGLLLVNVIFLAVLFQYLEKASETRSAAVNKILDSCLQQRAPYTPPAP